MKYTALTALLLGFLLLIPVGLIATQKAYAHVTPSLYISPKDTKFYGPCLVSTEFKIDVWLWNAPITGEDVYGFDFVVDWSNIATISIENVTLHSPWNSSFTIVNNYTSDAETAWHVAVLATGAGAGLTAVDQSVLTLWFHIDTDVCWPNSVIGAFLLTHVVLSGDGTKAVPITDAEIDSGTYEQYSVQPNIELSTTDAAYNTTTKILTEKCNSHTFDVEVDLTNVTGVYGFDFFLSYLGTELETDPQHITFKAAFPPPYETLNVNVDPRGGLYIDLVRPSEKPPVCGAVVPAVDIVFHTNDTADAKGMIPTASNSTISIVSADIFAKCPDPVTYSTNPAPCTPIAIPYSSGSDAQTWTGTWTAGGGTLSTPSLTMSNDGTNLYVKVTDGAQDNLDAAWFAFFIGTKNYAFGYDSDYDLGLGATASDKRFFYNDVAGWGAPLTGSTWTCTFTGANTFNFVIPLANIPGFTLGTTTLANVYGTMFDTADLGYLSTTLGSFKPAWYMPTYCINQAKSNATDLFIEYDGVFNGPAGALTIYYGPSLTSWTSWTVSPVPPSGEFDVPIGSNTLYNASGGDTIYLQLVYTADGITYATPWNANAAYTVPLGPMILLVPVPAIKYHFTPSSYDLNLDCVVDVQDLQKLLPYYGGALLAKRPAAYGPGGYGDLADVPKGSHVVDIFDFVAIAKHFGPVDP